LSSVGDNHRAPLTARSLFRPRNTVTAIRPLSSPRILGK